MATSLRERQCERNGARRIVFEAGGSYVGDWARDRKEGFGRQCWTNGDRYEGEWREGKPHGKGSLWKKTPQALRKQYAGDWVCGKRTGQGVSLSASGARYEGQFLENRRDGKGRATTLKGESYEGSWKRDKRHGLGAFRAPNGDAYEGQWLDDRKQGFATYTFSGTGKVLDCYFKDDAPRCGTSFSAQNEVLPAIALLEPESLLEKRVAQETVPLGSEAVDDTLSVLKHAFVAHDPDNTGLVPVARIPDLLDLCGLSSGGSSLQLLHDDDEHDDDATVTFAAFVDVATHLLQQQSRS
mmetsp:Transcript_24400/g.75326  ORF Transcript_24400/g.75326 Transcript_24400/m.75326 type:complete len:297 (+) Transcript_24400:48-938(+)